MKRILTIILFTLLFGTVTAQVSNLPMQIEGMPQNMSINPALAPKHSYLALPLLGSIGADFRTVLGYKDMIKEVDGTKYINVEKITSVLSSKNDVTSINFDWDILRGGFYVSKNDFIDLSIKARVHVGTSFPEGVLPFVMDNPIELTNGMFNLNMTPNVLGWGEFGVGYSRRINENFRVGIRAKYIFGLAEISSDGMNFNIEKDYDKYYLSGNYSLKGGNIDVAKMDVGKIFNSMLNNPGFGIDLGGEFVSDDNRIKAMLSISDFGMIFWNNKNSSSIVSNNSGARVEFDGFGDLSSSGKSFNEMADSVFRTVLNAVGSDTTQSGYTGYLPTLYHAMFEYALDEYNQHNLSVSFMGVQPYFGGFDYALSAGYTYRSKNGLWQLAGNYTYRPHIPIGIGIGASYNSRYFQIYLGCDNILPIFDVTNGKNMSARMAINFFF